MKRHDELMRHHEELLAAEAEVVSNAVVAALHTLIDIASNDTDTGLVDAADQRMEAATRILAYASDLSLPDFDDPEDQESEEVADGGDSGEG